MRKISGMIAMALALVLGFSGCAGEGGAVPAEQVGLLATAAISSEKFAGVVVTENAVEIRRDSGKRIKELYVEEGQLVSADQQLFSYDSDELNLTLDKQELEMDRLNADISDREKQITEVKKELDKAEGDTKTQLNIQLRQLETELAQAKYDKNVQQAEIDHTKEMIRDVVVRSPIEGTVRRIDTVGEVYITIQQSGAFQIRGLLNELSLAAGIMEGANVTVISRVDPGQTWTGVVSMVDYNTAETNSYDQNYSYSDTGLTGSTSYPFYITLDSTEGLLLGQHVYIQAAGEQADPDKLRLPGSYVMDVGYSQELGSTAGFVWAVDANGKLSKRQIQLGDYDVDLGCYVILDGLTEEDYIADPSNPGCREGAPVSIRSPEDFAGSSATQAPPETSEETPTESASESTDGETIGE